MLQILKRKISNILATVVTSLQIKVHQFFVSYLKIDKRIRLCYNKKAQSFLRLLGGLRAINVLKKVK